MANDILETAAGVNSAPELSEEPNENEVYKPQQPVDLPEDLIAEIRSLIKRFGLEEMPNRRQELLRAREGRFFWEGYQYPMYNSDMGIWAVPESGGFPWGNGTSEERTKRFYYVHNVYTPLGKTLVSTLCAAPPPIRFNPNDPMEINDIDAAKEADKYRQLFYKNNDIGKFLQDLGRYLYTDGRTVAWVKQVTDGVKFGYNPDGTPKTAEVAELFGVLETKVPISLRGQCEFPYFIISREKHVSELRDKYRDKADKILDHQPGPGEDAFDRTCRLAVLQGTEFASNSGESYNHLVTEQTTWIRPSAFAMVKDKVKREALQMKFKRGLRVVYAGEAFLEAVDESMDDCLTLMLPISGDGQAIPSLGRFVIPLQKRLNNLTNMVQEKYEKGQPTKFIDSKAVDTDGMVDQTGAPEVYMPIKNPNPGEPLSNIFFKEPEPQASPDMLRMIADLKGADSQFVSGAQPALFGGSMTNAKAAAIYAQARDQAIGSLAMTYGPMKTFLCRTVQMAALYAEEREAEKIVGQVPDQFGGAKNIGVDLERLRAGFYKAEPEVDEGLPESPSAQRAAFMQMIQFMGPNPQFQQLLMQPDNQYLFKQQTGIKGFTIPGADQRNVQLREIEKLLDGEPEKPTDEEIQKVAQHQTMLQIAGQPSPQPKPEDMLRPSVDVDAEFDDNRIHYLECVRWMYSDEGQRAKINNPKGYENVRLHAMAHKRAMAGGPDAAAPLQDNVPNPQVAQQGAAAQAAVAEHAANSGPQPGAGGPPAPPRLLNSGARPPQGV